MRKVRKSWSCLLATVALWGTATAVTAMPVENPAVANQFDIELISGSTTAPFTQLAFHPDGRLYAATFGSGILRFDYDLDGPLTNQIQASAFQSLGVAFHDSPVHGLCMYLSTRTGNFGEIRRLTDDDGDGQWGEAGETSVAIADSIPVGLHQIDQIQILDDALYVGIGNRTDEGTDESSYSGTICWIQDLDAVASTTNSAGFDGVDFFTDPIPYTSTSPSKLIVHSGTTRNPFGLAFDGDGNLWMTNNQNDFAPVRQDELFLAFEKADFGFAAMNSQVDWRTNPAALAAGFFAPANLQPSLTVATPNPGYDPDDPTPGPPPGGLGPHSSADGFCFYDGNELPLRFHQDAFVVRASTSDTSFTGLPETYQDLVAVDRVTGEVVQIADDFNRPLDATCDAEGNILVAEVGSLPGMIYRVFAQNPVTTAHSFSWAQDGDGVWSNRFAWDSGVSFGNRLVPAEWGSARYAVTIDRASAQPTVSLDQPARIESLLLGDALEFSGGALEVREDLSLTAAAEWRVRLSDELAPTLVGGTVTLAGTLTVGLEAAFVPAAGDSFVVLVADALSGAFASASFPDGVTGQVYSTANELGVVIVSTDTSVPGATGDPGLSLVGRHPVRGAAELTFQYQVTQPGEVELAIFDVAGRRVQTLVAQEMAPGAYTAVWNAGSSRSGVYFARLQTSGRRLASRVVVLD